MMAHQVAWLSLVAGAKLWFVAPPDATPTDRTCTPKIDYARAKRERVKHCIQMPGETIVVSDFAYHATCNLEPYTLGAGGQSESKDTPKWTIQTQDPFTAGGRSSEPRLEIPFQIEYMQPDYVEDSRMVPPLYLDGQRRTEL